MELFVPLPHPAKAESDQGRQALKSLTQRVRAKLADTMEIVTETFDYAQDAFAFVDGVLYGDWDAAAGEPEFTINAKLDYALRQLGFRPCGLPQPSVFTPPNTEADLKVDSYRSDNIVVVMSAERSDRGRHIHLIVRFGEMDPRLDLPPFID